MNDAANGKTNRRQSVRNTAGLKRGGSPGRPKGIPNKVTIEGPRGGPLTVVLHPQEAPPRHDD